MPWYLGNNTMIGDWMRFLFVPIALWSLIWKGLALWHSARREEKGWFIALLVINSVGILEIIYLAFVVKVFGKAPPKRARK